jgi:Flp pilus assembly protein TadG
MARRLDDGQAAVELALTVPLVVVLLLAVVQVVVVARDQVAVVHAAREAARAAAVAADPAASGTAAARRAASGLDLARLRVSVASAGDEVRVTIRYRSVTDVPLAGLLVGDVELEGRAVMQREPDVPVDDRWGAG